MSNTIKTLRSSTAGLLPPNGSRQYGELWVNVSDQQFGYIDAAQIAQKLLAVRYFSSAGIYAIGDFVLYSGSLYQSIANQGPSAFSPANWVLMFSVAGGTLTGPLILAADPVAALGAATKQYADKMLPLVGGTLTGDLTIDLASGDPTILGQKINLSRWAIVLGNSDTESGGNTGSDYNISRYDDAGVFIDSPIQIARSTGIVSIAHAPVNSNDVANKSYVDAITTLIGSVVTFAGSVAPTGWLLCDGTIYNIVDYPNLAAVITNTYGGDGVTTFAVPNCTGRVIVGAGAGYALAATGGEATHTLATGEIPVHNHGVTQSPHTHTPIAHTHGITNAHTHTFAGVVSAGGSSVAAGVGWSVNNLGTTGDRSADPILSAASAFVNNANANITINNAGGGGAHNNLQPYIAMNSIIRAL